MLFPKAIINAEKHRITALNRSSLKRYDFPANERPRTLYYVRYADDFLIGINGPRSLAIEVEKEVLAFIGSDLHFKSATAELHHARSDWVDFLGFSLQFRSNVSVGKPGKEMEAIKRFQERAKKNTLRIKAQYYNSSVRLGKIAFFDKIHQHAKDYQTFMDKRALVKAGTQEAEVALLRYFQRKVAELSEKAQKIEESEDKEQTPVKKVDKDLYFANTKARRKDGALVSLGRELKIFGKVRIANEGKQHLHKLLGSEKLKDFESCLELGNKLDKSKSKLVEIIQNSKGAISGKTTTVSKPQTFGVYIRFPKNKIMERLKVKGLVDSRSRPRSYTKILNADDITIITYFDGVARGLLNYYSPCHNFWDLRSLIDYHIRYSLLATLGHKRKGSITKAIKEYGKDPKVTIYKSAKNTKTKRVRTKPETFVQFITAAELAKKTRSFRLPETGRDDLALLENKLKGTPGVNMFSLPT